MMRVKRAALVICLAVMPGLAWAGTWIDHTHGCAASVRTDAIHRDADGTLWVGCGTNSSGFGLFYSQDSGASWAPVSTQPEGSLAAWRVNSIHRGFDGALYIGGIESATATGMVAKLDTTNGPPFSVSPVLVPAPFIGYNFTVANYRDLSDGRGLAHALTGTGLLFRPSSTTGESAQDWEIPDPALPFFFNLITANDKFHASGGTINTNPRVFLPPIQAEAAPWALVEIILDPVDRGQIDGIAASSERVVGAGINHVSNRGQIFVSSSDPYDASAWIRHDLSTIVGPGDTVTWARGVCMQGDLVVVVGERQPLVVGGGLVVLSTDGGQTFTDISPSAAPATISRCLVDEDGIVIVAGSQSYLGLWTGAAPADVIFQSRFETPAVD